jgi:hypothetical protein
VWTVRVGRTKRLAVTPRTAVAAALALLALAGLLVGVDRLTLVWAQSRVAERARRTEGLSARPDVRIEGFPFLTQLAGHRLREVRVDAREVTTGKGGHALRITRFAARLRGVRLGGGTFSVRSAVAESASGTARIDWADLTRAAPPGVTVSWGGRDAGGHGRVKVTFGVSGVPVLGTVHESVTSRVSVKGRTISLAAGTIPDVTGLPSSVERWVRDRIDFHRTLTGLPRGTELGPLVVGPDGVTVRASGHDVRLAG